jgi:hypothetical protein
MLDLSPETGQKFDVHSAPEQGYRASIWARQSLEKAGRPLTMTLIAQRFL